MTPTSKRAWGGLADEALDRFLATEAPTEGALAYASVARALAYRRGWDDPAVATYLERLEGTRNPDGGFGLGRPYDAFQTGETNDADTSYTVTTASHVGRVLIDGARAGMVPPSDVERLVDHTMSAPRVSSRRPGECIGYSVHQRDAEACVHNVNASAGAFLLNAWSLGVRRPGVLDLVAQIARREALAYRADRGAWPYMDGTRRLNDLNHNAASVEAALVLVPAIGQHALAKVMRQRDYAKWIDPLGQVRLLPFTEERPPDLVESGRKILADSQQTAALLAQCALWMARAADQP